MAKKRRPQAHEPAEDYYKLKTQAVEDLVTADEENSPPVPKEELQKYHAGGKKGFPNWLKMGFIKFWFPASVCYFFFWGLSLYVPSMLDLLFITGLALGVVTDLLTNNVIRFFADTEGANDRYMMFPKKRFITLFQNIFYAFILLFLVYSTYIGVNKAYILLSGASPDTVFLGVEPILFGLFYLLYDALLTFGKNALARRWTAVKNKNV